MAGELTRAETTATAAPVGPPEAVAEEEARRLGLPMLSILALLIGLITGLGAFVFRELIGLVHNVLFLGQLSFAYDSNVFTPPHPWGAFVILVPVIGAIGVTFLVVQFAPEAKGHGVPEVMDAIYYGSGVIRPVVAVVKSLASALAIGSGAAVGPRGADHPDRLGAGLDAGPAPADVGGPAHHAGRRGRRRRHRRHLQHADRRGALRHRADDARDQRRTPSCRWRWRPARRPSSAGSSSATSRPSSVPAQLAAMPTSLSGVPLLVLYALLGLVVGVAAAALHPRARLGRGCLRARARPLHAPCASACCWSAS